MTAYQAVAATFNQQTIAAYELIRTDPVASLAAIDAVLGRTEAMEAESLAVIAAMGVHSVETDEEARADWRSRRTSAIDMRFAAAILLGRTAEVRRTAEIARRALADRPDDPYFATIIEREAELADNLAERDTMLDDALARRVAAGALLEAARNRFRAATLSGGDGRITRLRHCARQAIDIADAKGFRREAIWFRVQLYGLLLIWDVSGVTRDEVRRANDFIGRLRGRLPERLESSYAAAIAAAPDEGPALETERDDLRLELLLLAADLKSRLGDDETPVLDILQIAERRARTPEQIRKVFAASARSWAGLGNGEKALDYARRDVEISRGISAETYAQAISRLGALEQREPAPDPDADPDEIVQRGIEPILLLMRSNQNGPALARIETLLPYARSADNRALLTTMRGSTLLATGRALPAAADFAAAVAVAETGLAEDPDAQSNLAGLWENALLLRAVALTRLGRAVEAWEAAERARSPVLRQLTGIAPASWAETRQALVERRAAMLSISALRWGTLVLSAAPGEAEPQAVLLDGLLAADVNRLLDAAPGIALADESEAWTAKLFGAAPELSALLMPQLGPRLRALAAAADILYLIPDDKLFQAPIAALEVRPGQTFSELMPFSIIPFAALLGVCLPSPPERRAALLIASGADTQGYDFAGHLDVVGPALGWVETVRLEGAAAIADTLLEQAMTRDILYVSSHGVIDSHIADVAQASYLLLHDRHLTAAEVGNAKLGAGLARPGLTFLNACQSGRFRRTSRSELGGFPAAMLRAGRRTLVAPLTHVDPHAAGALAAYFFSALMGGDTAACALQRARRALAATGAPAADWAAHTMFGVDF